MIYKLSNYCDKYFSQLIKRLRSGEHISLNTISHERKINRENAAKWISELRRQYKGFIRIRSWVVIAPGQLAPVLCWDEGKCDARKPFINAPIIEPVQNVMREFARAAA